LRFQAISGPEPVLLRAITFLAALTVSAVALPARASDVISATPTSGLHLSDSSGLSLDSEHLTIAADHIHLEYAIRNTGKSNLVRQASFPLPVFDRAPLEAERALDGANAANPLALTVNVNGAPQPLHTDSAIVGHADGMMKPIRVTRTWTQIFPAGQTVTIGLDYKTAAGVNASYPLSTSDAGAFCVSDTMRKHVNDRIDAGFAQFDVLIDSPPGALPSGPVGEYTLTLDKAAPTDVLSLCFPGDLKKVSATRFVATRENFTPPAIVHVMFVGGASATP
jgi:hypothetical protein